MLNEKNLKAIKKHIHNLVCDFFFNLQMDNIIITTDGTEFTLELILKDLESETLTIDLLYTWLNKIAPKYFKTEDASVFDIIYGYMPIRRDL